MQEQTSHNDNFVLQNADEIRKRLVLALGEKRGERARIARATGIGSGHLTQLLNGTNPLRFRYVQLICDALGVNVDWALTGEGHHADVDVPTRPGLSSAHGMEGALSPDQVVKLLAAAERERLTPDERRLLNLYQSLPPDQRARLWALVGAGAVEPPEEPVTTVNEGGERKAPAKGRR